MPRSGSADAVRSRARRVRESEEKRKALAVEREARLEAAAFEERAQRLTRDAAALQYEAMRLLTSAAAIRARVQ